jgi:hypothetical protein
MPDAQNAMGWEHFNIGLMEGIDFSLKTRNLILPVFDNATNALTEEWKKYEETFAKQIADAYKRDEGEGGMMSQERFWEEDLHRQRLQGVGALALDWLMSSVQIALRGAKAYLDKTHPPKPPYNKNNEGWLGCAADEYQKRFGIDLKAGPVSFERIQELVLARNAGIHRENKGNLKAYVDNIKNPVFVDGEYFFVKRADLVAIIDDSERFITWMVSEIEKLRPSQESRTTVKLNPPGAA